jgi:hypothetical protein
MSTEIPQTDHPNDDLVSSVASSSSELWSEVLERLSEVQEGHKRLAEAVDHLGIMVTRALDGAPAELSSDARTHENGGSVLTELYVEEAKSPIPYGVVDEAIARSPLEPAPVGFDESWTPESPAAPEQGWLPDVPQVREEHGWSAQPEVAADSESHRVEQDPERTDLFAEFLHVLRTEPDDVASIEGAAPLAANELVTSLPIAEEDIAGEDTEQDELTPAAPPASLAAPGIGEQEAEHSEEQQPLDFVPSFSIEQPHAQLDAIPRRADPDMVDALLAAEFGEAAAKLMDPQDLTLDSLLGEEFAKKDSGRTPPTTDFGEPTASARLDLSADTAPPEVSDGPGPAARGAAHPQAQTPTATAEPRSDLLPPPPSLLLPPPPTQTLPAPPPALSSMPYVQVSPAPVSFDSPSLAAREATSQTPGATDVAAYAAGPSTLPVEPPAVPPPSVELFEAPATGTGQAPERSELPRFTFGNDTALDQQHAVPPPSSQASADLPEDGHAVAQAWGGSSEADASVEDEAASGASGLPPFVPGHASEILTAVSDARPQPPAAPTAQSLAAQFDGTDSGEGPDHRRDEPGANVISPDIALVSKKQKRFRLR